MNSDYYINLHFNQAIPQKTGYAFKIGDKGCTFHLHCVDLDPKDMDPHIVFNHINGTCVEGVPTGSGHDYVYVIAGNEFGVCGLTVVDMKFYDSSNPETQRISTASFTFEVLPDTLTPFDEASSSYADSLEHAREEIDAAILELQGAEADLGEAVEDLDEMSEEFADTLQDYVDAFGNTAPINPRGAYDPLEEYVPRDAVSFYSGGKTLTYINKQSCTGISPTDPDEGAAHWQIMIDVAAGGALSALEDVSIDPQTLADGQMLVFNGTDDVWENKSVIEDSLTSSDTDKALSAAKGKALQDNKQPKELETALTIDGVRKTTVEDALGGLNDYVDDTVEAAFDVYGAKNFNSYPYSDITKTENGITWTDNGDGTVKATGGTSGTYARFELHSASERMYIPNGTYIISGCPNGASETTYSMFLSYTKDGSTVGIACGELEIEFTIDGSDGDLTGASVRMGLDVESNVTLPIGGITFKPMIRDARVLDGTFVPFAKTNKQLTDDKAERNDLSTIHATGSTNTTGAQINAGTFFYLNGQFCKALTNIAVNATFTLDTNFKVDSVGDELTPKAVTVSTEAGISLVVKSVAHNNNSLVGTLRFSGITISNDWVVIGNISAHPTDTVVAPAVNMASGSPSFVARITNNGNIAVYGANGSGLTLQFCFACETTN